MSDFNILPIRKTNNKAAILFLHGFSGNVNLTWKQFIFFAGAKPALMNWDIFSIGYPTSPFPQIPFWTKNPTIDNLAQALSTQSTSQLLKPYKTLALVGHSMGGLIAQRAYTDYSELNQRVSHIINYGTPSLGLRKARYFGFANNQIHDMGYQSEFINELREKWDSIQKINLHMKFKAVAGLKDNFVPTESSLLPFPKEQQAVIEGDHVSMVRPSSNESLSVQILDNFISNHDAGLGPMNSAALAVETNQFHEAITIYQEHYEELDQSALVYYALALESLGQAEESIKVLNKCKGIGTDAQGTLAGRLKRRWWTNRKKTDAERSLQLYKESYLIASDKEDQSQCHYLAINVAFMAIAYDHDLIEAEKWARKAIAHAELSKSEKWANATQGEAYLYLGNTEKSLQFYKLVCLENGFGPRDRISILWQASQAAELLQNEHFATSIQNFINM